MSYADEYTDEKLKALEKKISSVYSAAYRETHHMAAEYFRTLETRYTREYTAMKASTNSLDEFAVWYRKERNPGASDVAIKSYWKRNQNTYTEESFKKWYATQVSRGERYEKMANDIAKRTTRANETAAAYVNDDTPTIYALNRNFTAYQIEGMAPGTSFEIYNEQAVKNLIMDNRNVTEFRTLRVNPVRDYEWNSDLIKQAVTSGIIRGISIDKLADEFMNVMQRNRAAAIRNARTAYTSAQNSGRADTMDAAAKMGIKVQKQWHSMEDARVRFTHALLNGQIRDKDKPFSNGLMFPGDSKGAPAEVYNCRCRMEYILPEYMDDTSNEMYDVWDKMTPAEKEAEKAKYNAWMKEQQQNRGKHSDYEFNIKAAATEKAIDFTPAATIDEAIKFAETLVDTSKWAAMGVNLSGVSLEVINEINKTVYEFQQTFDVGKLGGIFAPNGNSREGKQISDAKMAFSTVRETLFINKRYGKSLKKFDEMMTEEDEILAEYFKNPDAYAYKPAIKRILENSRKTGRATVPRTFQEGVWHELGHSLEKRIQKHPDYAKIDMNSYAESISGYATADVGEYYAESFCCYMKGEPIEPTLKKIFDSFRR